MAKAKSKEAPLQFPEPVLKRLLEINLSMKQLQSEQNTILGTFFSVVGIENPQEYDINIHANTITKKEVPTPKPGTRKSGTKS